jgi:hypothetical protein
MLTVIEVANDTPGALILLLGELVPLGELEPLGELDPAGPDASSGVEATGEPP